MNAAEPPRILLDGAGSCPSGPRLEALVQSSLGPARAPQTGWVVALRFERTTSKVLRAEGDITNGEGTPVARRVLSGSLADCDALARGIGVWASLVLQAEASRAEDAPPEATPSPSPAPSSRGTPVTEAKRASSAPARSSPSVPVDPDASAPRIHEDHAHEENGTPAAREARAFEIGLGTFLMAGPHGKALAGVTPYMFINAGHGFFVRPAIAVGEGVFVPAADQQMTLAAARIDGCLRVYGAYAPNHNLGFDLCAGAEGGFIHEWPTSSTVSITGAPLSATTTPYVAVGPSIEMDGDLDGALSLVLRGVAGANLVPDGLSGRIELALSWRLP